MDKFIRNAWRPSDDGSHEEAHILSHSVHPEGVDVWRVRARAEAQRHLDPKVGHIFSVISGIARLLWKGETLKLGPGVHIYLPRGLDVQLSAGFEGVLVSAGVPSQSVGKQPIVRDEEYLRGCAEETSFRWILTGQYLSRRIFLHHDETLRSRAGRPLSWFRTTMFDVAGLPENEHGHPVFKMSYNYRTEPNICYDVPGELRVRMALHPYSISAEEWEPWQTLDSDDTYHLNEVEGGPEEETSEANRKLRNRHEVSVIGGHASLFCIFDPAPTGIERHHPGTYSDYGPLSEVLETEHYRAYLRRLAAYDEMVDELSWAKASGQSASRQDTLQSLWQQGLARQERIEQELLSSLTDSQNQTRLSIVRPWTLSAGSEGV